MTASAGDIFYLMSLCVFVTMVKCGPGDTDCSGNNHGGGLEYLSGVYMSVCLHVLVRRHNGVTDSDSENFTGV